MTKKYFLLLLLVSGIHSAELPSGKIRPFGSYVITNFTADNGLPQNTVDLVSQTADGYIWIGTYAGLARYDGVKFVHFNKSITPAFKINHVTTLLQDDMDATWIGTNGGGLIHYAKHSFRSIKQFENGGKEYVRAILSTGERTLLVGSERGGIQEITIEQDGSIKSISPFAKEILPENFLLRTLIKDSKNRILVATDIGLIVLENGSAKIMTKAEGLPDNSILTLALDQQGNVWIGTSNGLARWSNGTLTAYTTADGLSNNSIRAMCVDANNTLWIGTDGGGVNRFLGTENGKKFDALMVEDGLVNNFIRTIFQDNERTIWIGTRNGLSQLHIRKFELLKKKNGLSDSYVRTVLEDSDKRVWVGTNGAGLNRIETNGTITRIGEKYIPNGFIRALFQDRNGVFWIGTDGGGVVRYDERKKPGEQFTSYTVKNGLTENYIRAFQEGFDGDLWIATYGGGISRLKDGVILPLTTKEGLANDNVLAMVKNGQEEIWVGTNGGGIHKITRDGIETINTDKGLSNNFILSLYADKEGVIWAGTNGGGINKISNDGISVYSTRDGLREDVTLMIIEDGNGYMWIGGNQGISRIPRSDFDAITEKRISKFSKIDFGASDGLQNAEISGVSTPCIIRSSDGKIRFTTVGGLAIVDPEQLIADDQDFPLHIEEIRTHSTIFYPDSVIEIGPGNSSIEFHYTALGYVAPERIRFRYKLLGFDDSWNDAGTRRAAYYTNIPPGQYTFCVSTSTDKGDWSTTEAQAMIILHPFFYQTWYFALLVGVGLVLAGAGLYALRTSSVHRHAKHLASVVEERTKDLVVAKEEIEHHLHEVEIARDALTQTNTRLDKANKEKSDLLGILSHDFKNKVVNLNHFAQTINSDKKNQTVVFEHSEMMEQTTEYMLRMIEDTLSSSALDQGQLVFTKNPIDVVQLAELIVLKNRIHVQKKSMSIRFSSNREQCFISGSERWMNEAVDNLINNAGKFSPAGSEIFVSVQANDFDATISVKDQGPGLTDDDKANLFQQFKRLSAQPTGGEISTGLGLSIVKKIVEMHNGKVWAESSPGNGATFFIQLPVLKNS